MFNLLNKIIPRHCLFCLQKILDNKDICEACFDAIAVNKSCCQRCASPIEQLDVRHNLLCGHCLSHQHDFDQVISPFLYSKEIRYLITSLKYQKKIHFAKVLAELFIQQVNNNSSFKLPQAIIPMPMHVKRLRDRGFNQALELSRYFSSYYALPLDYKSITRSRYTDLQAGLAASERQKNVANAFS
ncbi:MAG: ComF family protein, partial [Proteobacteria bacterium]|nr:ComF family protein [Pseudomonadota bacterium]